jgi:Mtf2 family
MSGVEPPPAGSWEFHTEKSAFRNSKGGHTEFELRRHFTKSFETNELEEENLEGASFAKSEAIEFDDDDLDADIWGKDETQELTDMHQNRGSTITVTERRAFQKIFSDIIESSRSSRKVDWFGDDGDELVTGPESKQKAKSKLDDILTTALRRESPSKREEIEAAVERYPPALQAAAARALGLVPGEPASDGVASTEDKLLDTEVLETLRAPECARVEGLMKNAKTDFELWAVMEKEVFPLINRLGLEDVPDPQATVVTKGLKSKKKRGKSTEETPEAVHQPESIQLMRAGGQISPLALYGPLYPSYLLFGLRLLDRGFAKPSSLALALLPKIKSFGFISHVLGASTQFYNELLRIYHHRQDDFRGMLDLLTEMENAALDVDEETLGIVIDVIQARRIANRGGKGPAIKALWGMPEFAPKKFYAWRHTIHSAMADRERNEAAERVRTQSRFSSV